MSDRSLGSEQPRRRVPRWLRRIEHYELTVLVMLALAAGGVWAFVELADEVVQGETDSFDRSLLLAMRNPGDLSDPIGPRWVEELFRDFTGLGGIGVLTFLTAAVTGFLGIERRGRAALLILVAVGGGLLLSTLLKEVFSRPRPDLVPHGSYVYTASFPSGHSMLSAATYLTLGALLARVQPRRRLKIYSLAVAILLTLLVGVSRVYLGVHWPTDVLAGWAAGAVWAVLCWLIARWLQRRGQLEQAGDRTAPTSP